ncbi:unnamed protein product [Arctia plantaginis]|uniref:Uncharacterized protein n=1 Tax=Arctia plantaginis TaxID=874455 RepID=A0A8S1B629_ARCPL|nr:unnamed protein product [Arctia plantaginis]
MPDWRYNVLSTNEAFIDTDGTPMRDPLAASYPRRADRSRPLHTCPYTTIFLGARSHHAPYRLPAIQNDSVDLYADVYSVDRSSNLTDTSSFARYEDFRPQIDETLSESDDQVYTSDKLSENLTLQVQKVPFTSSVFYISAKTETSLKDAVQNSDVLDAEESDSDALSSCTCDSFERCEFDCRDFEPFSDTCCCDPLSDGICSRSPKDVDSPEHFCDQVAEADGVSNRSDMDGLDLALFEPAQTESTECVNQPVGNNAVSTATALCGILHALADRSIGKLLVN